MQQVQTPEETATATPTLALSGVVKKFGGTTALGDVSLNILPGEVHALLGENGAGKSTLMNVASGSIAPDSGTIEVMGKVIDDLSPKLAQELGIAIVHQHPAVLPDMTVLENFQVALPSSVFGGNADRRAATDLLKRVQLDVHLDERVENLTVAQSHLLEIAKSLAVDPKVLVLDEPTAPLGSDSVDLLFGLVRDTVARGTAVVYITHRLGEVRDLADRVTVLRDGHVARSDALVSDVTDDELLSLIVGRRLASTFPPKHVSDENEQPNLIVKKLSGVGFTDIDLMANRGEIIGIAGVVGNGQNELLRSLAGLDSFDGSVAVGGKSQTSKQLLNNASYMPADRHHEGLIMRFSVGENAAIEALSRFKRGAFLSRRDENEHVSTALGALSVKAASLDAPVSSLSGGNQQKIVMGRTMLSEPSLVLADEPTQGVDVGARAELYQILRDISSNGTPVILASSDAKELEGLCDRVYVMSRGQIVDVLEGEDITEERMVHSAVGARTETLSNAAPEAFRRERSTRFKRFLQGDYAPSLLLIIVSLMLGGFIAFQNDRYLSDFNISSLLTLTTALGFIAIGQAVALLTGGLDLSVGPLAGFLVVIASFHINEDSPIGSVLLGFATMLGVAIFTGLINGTLIRYVKFTAIAATLTLYIALQGMSFILRSETGGYIDQGIVDIITMTIGPIPLAFIVFVLITLTLEYSLRKTRWGWNLRAVGSNEDNARRLGIKVNGTVVLAYVTVAVMTFLGAVMLMAQIGVGDPAQGVSYTLTSITAVVLGGTSLLGGRGTFVGTVLGAFLLNQVLNATVFLDLGQMWQYILQGLMILVAAIAYSLARSRKKRRASA